jgi:metallo-beta-lactamase family protein
MQINFLGAAQTVTGSFYVVETEKTRFAVDCGMFQGSETIEQRNRLDFTIDPKTIDFLILTHAHIDHSGLVPKLCKAGFSGPIYSSKATKELCAVMLPDSGNIQESEAKKAGSQNEAAEEQALEPIYTTTDAVKALEQFKIVDLDELQLPAADVKFRFREAGHILGSAIVELWLSEKDGEVKLVFSGDLGRPAQPFVNDPAFIEEADYLVLESTYGDRLHPQIKDRPGELKKIIDRTLKRGGNVIIPSFAVERAQDILFDLSVLQSQDRLNTRITIYIDSPLAIKATEIFKKNIELYDRETRQLIKSGHHPLKMPNLKYSHTKQESIQLNEVKTNAVIISASGMCDAGRIQYHLRQNLPRPESTILFVGYQAEGTLGREIISGAEEVELFGKFMPVRAEIVNNEAYSAHADQRDLVNWLAKFERKPKKVFIIHGEDEAQQSLAKLIEDELKIPTAIPSWQEVATLTTGKN